MLQLLVIRSSSFLLLFINAHWEDPMILRDVTDSIYPLHPQHIIPSSYRAFSHTRRTCDRSTVNSNPTGVEVKTLIHHHSQMKHGMHLGTPHLPSDIGTDDIDFFPGISQLAREDGVRDCFQTFIDLEIIPRSHMFLHEEMPTLAPLPWNAVGRRPIPDAGRPAKCPRATRVSAHGCPGSPPP